ncbi:uncharacterized protein LOC132721017 [Ruditapes philippinarum]|uniref:uncharacterized protein LOC132721017 n=1 Tax=Ruditapes philippinarum TaxID=129788 RepID=UPI00295BBD73|nr:uncharacterized protein LOC132721017 [Ruditapes philippinarum]
MHVTVILCVILGVTVTSANITGQHPASGTCLCLTGTNVHARSSAGLSGSIVATVSKPECYKFHGGILTKDGYTWYQLQHVNGHNAWVAGTFLSTSTASHCSGASSTSGSGTCSDATAKDYACKLLHLADAGTITLWKQHPSGVHDNAYSYNNIKDACNGHAASRSHYTCSECRSPGAPGGHVCLSRNLLHYIYAVHQRLGYIHVNEVAGACHSCTSKHYLGRAVDLHNPSGQSSTMLSLCTSMGGWGQNEGDHVHCQFTS